MKTEWNYTALADAYIKRPDYAPSAIDAMWECASMKPNAEICDIGAGVGHLTLELMKRGAHVTAVEPNDAMRANGKARTEDFENVKWVEGSAEQTGLSDTSYDMATFGSSFNVCDQDLALMEMKRVVKAKGWFACMWNHRDLSDNIQGSIEKVISDIVPGYSYGNRREDQSQKLNASGLFESVQYIEGTVSHTQTVEDCIEAWRSHATLERQSKERFGEVISQITNYLRSLETFEIQVPYTTRMWVAKFKE